MFTKKFKQSFIRYGLSKRAFISLFSCALLFICGVLSSSFPVDAAFGFDEQYKDKTKVQSAYVKSNQDPTRPPSVIVQQLASKVEAKPEYVLTAIFMRNNQHYAVVNGNIVQAGDNISNMLVKEITPTNLTMLNTIEDQNRMVLELSGATDIKKQVVKQ